MLLFLYSTLYNRALKWESAWEPVPRVKTFLKRLSPMTWSRKYKSNWDKTKTRKLRVILKINNTKKKIEIKTKISSNIMDKTIQLIRSIRKTLRIRQPKISRIRKRLRSKFNLNKNKISMRNFLFMEKEKLTMIIFKSNYQQMVRRLLNSKRWSLIMDSLTKVNGWNV